MFLNRSKPSILLIHAPFKPLGFGKNWQKTDSLAPPLGLMYLAAPLVKQGYPVEFIDLNVDQVSKAEFKQAVKHAPIVGISCYSDSLKNVKQLIKRIRQIHPKTYIICGGPYCNLTQNLIPGADLITVGEAEQQIVAIVKRITQRKSLKSIPGLVYRSKRKIIHTGGIMKVADLDTSELPVLSLAAGKDYGHFYGLQFTDMIGVMSSRGCPFRCRYCTHHQGVTHYRERSVAHVMQELDQLCRAGYKYIIFYDDNFLVNKRRVTEIMEAIVRKNLKIKILCQGRIDSGDEAFYRKLRQGGVLMIMYGIESANQDVLDFYNKRISLKTIRKTITLANKYDIVAFGYFIIGAPMETRKHFENNLKLADEAHLDLININILGYYQGSDLWNEAVKEGLIKKNETIVWANKTLSQFSFQELMKIKEETIRRFYLRPSRWFRLVFKAWRQQELPLIFKILKGLNINFFRFAKNPFVPEKSGQATMKIVS